MGKNARNREKNKAMQFFGDNFWQSRSFNDRCFAKNLHMLYSLAINRFRWVNLPETCDSRYLEWTLHMQGVATICHSPETPDVWQSLRAMFTGDYNIYGYPVSWTAAGFGSEAVGYNVTPDNGELVYYARAQQWAGAVPFHPDLDLQQFARKMTHYERTEDINLSHQHTPWVFIAPQSKKQEVLEIFKQVAGGEPAVIGDNSTREMISNITAIKTDVPLIVEDLARAKQNVLNEALLYLGIPHLAFEKGERMIEDEARANTAPTNVMLLDCLAARREACEKLNRRFGLDIQVYFNEDYESYNWNYINNLEAQAQDGLLNQPMNVDLIEDVPELEAENGTD